MENSLSIHTYAANDTLEILFDFINVIALKVLETYIFITYTNEITCLNDLKSKLSCQHFDTKAVLSDMQV